MHIKTIRKYLGGQALFVGLLFASLFALLMPASPAFADPQSNTAPPYYYNAATTAAWVNMQTISYGGLTFVDANPYDSTYTFIYDLDSCRSRIQFQGNPYDGSKSDQAWISLQAPNTGGGGCNRTTPVDSSQNGNIDSPSTKLPPLQNENNRNITFFSDADGDIKSISVTGMIFTDSATPGIYLSSLDTDGCTDYMKQVNGNWLLFAAEPLKSGSSVWKDFYTYQGKSAPTGTGGTVCTVISSSKFDSTYGNTYYRDPMSHQGTNGVYGAYFIRKGTLANASGPNIGATAGAPGSGESSNGGGKNNDNDPDPCGIPPGPLRWIACPITTGLKQFTDFMSDAIESLLTTPTEQIFDTQNEESARSYYKAWSVFRNLGIGLIIIAGLVMVISQAAGMEIFDAYTVRKVLPRLVIAMIGITLSWFILQFVVTFFNDIGQWARDLILAPFSGSEEHFSTAGAVINYLLVGVGGAAAAISLVLLGFAGVLSLLGTIALALLIGLFVLAIRQLIVVVAILMAPLAIAAYILPGTQKLWNFWRESLLTALMMFPIIMAFLAAGQAMAFVANQSDSTMQHIIALLVYFAPYALLPFAFKLAGGLMSTIFSITNDSSRGLFDRGKKFREGKRAENMGALKQGFQRTKLGSSLERRKQLGLAKREAWGSGAIGIGKHGSASYHTALRNTDMGQMAAKAAESIKNNPSAAANDDANKVAQYATSRDDFIRRYGTMKAGPNANQAQIDASIAKYRAEALDQLTYTEQAFGASMGSRQMRHTATTAALSSNSSTDTIAERAGWMRHAISDGFMTNSQAAALVKQSGSLMASASFGDLLGAADGTKTDAAVLAAASQGFNPANSHRMRKGQAQELAKHMLDKATEAATVRDASGKAIRIDTSSDAFAQTVADSAGIHDLMNGMTPEVREEFAKYLNGAAVAGKYMREHEATMEAAGNGAYLDRRKTWASTAAAAGGATPPGLPPLAGGPGAGGGGSAGGPPSDARLKRDIKPLGEASGIPIYSFRYLWSEQIYVGVMAQDIVNTHPEALLQDELGFYGVSYDRLGLRMMTLEEWQATKSVVQPVS